MVDIIVDGKKVKVKQGSSVIQACEKAGVEVPRFCYHDKLKVAGNCRMCLVEVEGSRKPIASCATPVAEGMVVKTDTKEIKKSREGVMEFLLMNHPLDCPVCDQAGECDLQDQAMKYGRGSSRFDEDKRAVQEKNMGPLIKTHMTRCIHCTRCIRFSTDVAGVEELGAFGRGEDMEVATYVGNAVASELSGNMIDICPVGALTSKPYAFKARNWELNKTETIDVSDAVGSNIRVDSRGMEVMRILPRLNESINEEWISDKTRFMYDGLKYQRIDRPYIRKGTKLKPATWAEAFSTIVGKTKRLKGENMGAIIGDMVDSESIMVLKDIMNHFDSPNMDSMPGKVKFDVSNRSSYLFNTTIEGIEKSDLCLLVGVNPRHEATMVNARIRKRFNEGGYKVFSVGGERDLSYKSEWLGDDISVLKDLASGAHPLSDILSKAKKPMMIIGYGVLSRGDSDAVLGICNKVIEKYRFVDGRWNGFNILHTNASAVGALDLRFVPGRDGLNTDEIIEKATKKKMKFLYLLGADNMDVEGLKAKSFIVYQGHHGDRAANIADVVLPGAAFTEKSATYVNLEGRAQRTNMSVAPPGQAQEDWKILMQLASELNVELKYNNLNELRGVMASKADSFKNIDQVVPAEWKGVGNKKKSSDNKISDIGINYYMSNVICRASKTMIACADKVDKGVDA